MITVLKKIYNSKSLASFYTNCDEPNKFQFGKIVALKKNKMAIQTFSLDGDDDGIQIINPEIVFRVEINDQYYGKMKKLMTNKVFDNYNFLSQSDDIMLSILYYAKEHQQIVSIEQNDSGYLNIVGFINNIEDKLCCLRQIDEYGMEDGLSYIQIKTISTLSIGSSEEKRVQKLWNKNT